MKEKLYKNRNWMHYHYAIREESTCSMAQEADCTDVTIGNWLHKFNILIRTRKESALLRNAREFQPYRNEDWLREHYVEMQESTHVMEREAGCNHDTIWNWLRKFDIPTRTSGEGTFLANKNFLDLSDKLSNLLEGELLGDGHIGMNGSRSAKYTHSSKYEEYLIWLSSELADLGLEQVGKIGKYWSKKSRTFYYNYTSKSYPELVPIRERWYPNGSRIKIVPQDLILAPIMARRWYIGDGCLHNQEGMRPDIYFSTDDFDKPSINHLLEELRSKGFKVNHWLASNKIGMSVHSVKDFLGWIGPCPIDCYSYKWDYQDNRKGAQAEYDLPDVMVRKNE